MTKPDKDSWQYKTDMALQGVIEKIESDISKANKDNCFICPRQNGKSRMFLRESGLLEDD